MTRFIATAALALVLHVLIAPFTLAGLEELDEDFDGDGVINRFDNCYLFANPLQGDADGDGFGNQCDIDLNNDLLVNFDDLALFQQLFFTDDPAADFNEDGAVNFLDLRIFKLRFGSSQPGPAIVVRWVGGSGQWNNPFNWMPNALPTQNFVHAEITGINDVVEIPEGFSARAKTLILNGAIDLCGNLRVNQDFIVNGQIDASCPFTQLSGLNGLDLGGEIQLQRGLMELDEVRKIPNTDPVIRIKEAMNTEVSTTDFFLDFRSEVNIEVLPGGNLILPHDLILADATLTLISEVDRPGRVFMGEQAFINGSGNLVFSGPDDSRATGQMFLGLSDIELGPGIAVSLEPGAHGYFRTGTTTFRGDVQVAEGATLYFPKFSVTNVNGNFSCSSGGRILEESFSGPADGDSVLINNPSGSMSINNCETDWPARLVNFGTYSVNASTLVLPLIGAGGQPLSILQSDVTIDDDQQPLPADFYLLTGDTQNTFSHSGFFNLGGEVLDIDATRWSFDAFQFVDGSVLLNGTVRSTTPLTVNTGARLRLDAIVVEPEIQIETGSTLVIDESVSVEQSLYFVEQPSCNPTMVLPGVLEFRSEFAGVAEGVDIVASSSSSAELSPCLKGDIISAEQPELLLGVDIHVTNAELNVRADDNRRIRLDGTVSVSGNNSHLGLQQVVNNGTLACEAGASLYASGTSTQPFVNASLINAQDCAVTFDNYWRNDVNATLTGGTLNLLGPVGESLDFGAGNFISALTDITFEINLNDLSVLSVFKPIPPGGSFTLLSSLNDIGPLLNTSDLPFNTQFVEGFELTGKVVSGSQPLRLTGDATLTDVETSAHIEVSNSAVVTLAGSFSLENADLILTSNDLENSTVLIDNAADTLVTGTGTVRFEANGSDATAALLGTSTQSIVIDPTIALDCAGSGRCLAGAGSGHLFVEGDITVSGTGTRFETTSDIDMSGTTTLLDRAQLFTDSNALAFSGSEAELVIELFDDTGTNAAVVANDHPASSISIGDASLTLRAGDGFTLADATEVYVLEHPNAAQRLGEFADISNAVIDGQMLSPDYSSPDVTLFRGPNRNTPAVGASAKR